MLSQQQSVAARVLPDQVLAHLRFARARRAWKSAGVAFVHIPKNGGVSVSRALYGRPLGHYRVAEIHRRDPRLLGQVYSFAVLRDPVARAISAYRFATAGSTQDMAVANPHLYRTAQFADFDTFVGSWLAHQDLNAIDGIFRPQVNYVTAGSRLAVDDLFRLEDLKPLIAAMRTRGFPEFALGHTNATDKRNSLSVSPDSERVLRQVYHADYDLISALTW